MTLFDRPFDLAVIDRILREDAQRFCHAAFVVIGLPGRWDGAVDELVELYEAYAAAGMDDAPLWRLFDLLSEHTRGREDRRERILRFADRLGFGWVLGEKLYTPPDPAGAAHALDHFRRFMLGLDDDRLQRHLAQARDEREHARQAALDALHHSRGMPTAADISRWPKLT